MPLQDYPELDPRLTKERRSRLVVWLALVVLCAVVLAAAGGAVYMVSSARAASQAAHRTPTPQQITLLSPDANGDAHPDTSTPLNQELPTLQTSAPGGLLAPYAASDYELQLIASVGTPQKAIVVSLQSQTMHVYENGAFIAGPYVITGRPELPTPRGVYQILNHIAPATLYSPWPPGSAFYYPPTPVNYTMEFRLGGFLIHDAPWHHVWGPGMNAWHFDPVAKEWQWGSHGCVGAPTPFVKWLYSWADDGSTVIIY